MNLLDLNIFAGSVVRVNGIPDPVVLTTIQPNNAIFSGMGAFSRPHSEVTEIVRHSGVDLLTTPRGTRTILPSSVFGRQHPIYARRRMPNGGIDQVVISPTNARLFCTLHTLDGFDFDKFANMKKRVLINNNVVIFSPTDLDVEFGQFMGFTVIPVE